MSNSHHETKSKTGLYVGLGAAAIAAIAALILLTDIDLTSTGEMPSVQVDGGELPTVDVDVADIDVGTKKMEVKVPTIDIDLPKEGEEADDLADNIEVDVDVDADVEVKPDQ